jgi:hypothetical protein
MGKLKYSDPPRVSRIERAIRTIRTAGCSSNAISAMIFFPFPFLLFFLLPPLHPPSPSPPTTRAFVNIQCGRARLISNMGRIARTPSRMRAGEMDGGGTVEWRGGGRRRRKEHASNLRLYCGKAR